MARRWWPLMKNCARHSSFRRESGAGAGVAFGAAFEAFDPARARADEDLESRRQMGEVLPTPDPEHPVWNVDLQRNQVRIPRPR